MLQSHHGPVEMGRKFLVTVAIKGPRTGIAQAEFEYEVPIADAESDAPTYPRRSESRLPIQPMDAEPACLLLYRSCTAGFANGIHH
jgi:hypothetical protein